MTSSPSLCTPRQLSCPVDPGAQSHLPIEPAPASRSQNTPAGDSPDSPPRHGQNENGQETDIAVADTDQPLPRGVSSPDEMAQTPMMKQYYAAQLAHPDSVVLFRVGDFFEIYHDDAKAISQALGLHLTHRGTGSGKKPIPMCGVPSVALNVYISRLIRHGWRLALCDQTETAETKSGSLVERRVTRLITAATNIDGIDDDDPAPNLLLCIAPYHTRTDKTRHLVLSWTDITLGDVFVHTIRAETLDEELERLGAREIIVSEEVLENPTLLGIFHRHRQILNPLPSNRFNAAASKQTICEICAVPDPEMMGVHDRGHLIAVGTLLGYLRSTHPTNAANVRRIQEYNRVQQLKLDATSRRHLELLHGINGDTRHGLLFAITSTVTALGKRTARDVILNPSKDLSVINGRLESIDWLMKNPRTTRQLREQLRQCSDAQRALGRIRLGRWSIRDLLVLRETLAGAKDLANTLGSQSLPLPDRLSRAVMLLRGAQGITQRLHEALTDDPASTIESGVVVRHGYAKDLDKLRQSEQLMHNRLHTLTNTYRKQTHVTSLHIRRNDALGYFVEVPNKLAPKLSGDIFRPRQTLSNQARFDTDELRHLGLEVDNSQARAHEREQAILNTLAEHIASTDKAIVSLCHAIGFIDWAVDHALIAKQRNYVRPTVDDTRAFAIRNGRHPMVEHQLIEQPGSMRFAPNDCVLQETQRLWLLTGPNMAGKSTFLRQNAIIALLAHCGCFVPADSAHLGLIDRIFTRVGASDNLSAGQSTFMIEMIEVATILRLATNRSLLVIDEIGRGTAVQDGLAIAWACVEHLHDITDARTLFATHYHELGQLTNRLERVFAARVKVKRVRDTLVFLHQISPGLAESSFGVDVAQMAGLPQSTIQRARHIQRILDQKRQQEQHKSPLAIGVDPEQLAISNELATLSLSAVSDSQLRDLIQSWQNRLLGPTPDSSCDPRPTAMPSAS